LTHLILSPGHAVWNLRDDPYLDASWHLRSYQRGEPRYYIEHIRRAVELAAEDAEALLIFSGCYTSAAIGPLNEATGYWMIAERFGWWGRTEARGRSTLEDFARDSFENLLYSICRFREYAGDYPGRITVAGWGFKRARFTELHRAAIRFPAGRFAYDRVNDPADADSAEAQEAATRRAFAADPYGASGELAAKKRERDPLRRQHGYGASCPELAELLRHRGPEIFGGRLPW
jgi:hypothetical protein